MVLYFYVFSYIWIDKDDFVDYNFIDAYSNEKIDFNSAGWLFNIKGIDFFIIFFIVFVIILFYMKHFLN